MKQLHGKVALITGASSGIGRATATLFAAEGASVVLAARRLRELQTLKRDIESAGGQAEVLAGDVSDEKYARALVDLSVRSFGGLDVAFNNAGILGAMADATEISRDQWDNTLETNLTGAFLGAKHQINEMKHRGGSIIFTSSFVGITTGMPQMAAYAASKAGLIGLARALAVEYGSAGIRVNALVPGGTDTDMAREFGDDPQIREFVNRMHALKRRASPQEIARSALYLASDASSFTTGSAMMVEGGISISKT